MDLKTILEAIDSNDRWASSINKDIPLFLQDDPDIDIKRIV